MAEEAEAGGRALGQTGALVDCQSPQGAAIGENADAGKAGAHVPTTLAAEILGLEASFLSMCGMVALAGVVVNDALVMVVFINQNAGQKAALPSAVRQAGRGEVPGDSADIPDYRGRSDPVDTRGEPAGPVLDSDGSCPGRGRLVRYRRDAGPSPSVVPRDGRHPAGDSMARPRHRASRALIGGFHSIPAALSGAKPIEGHSSDSFRHGSSPTQRGRIRSPHELLRSVPKRSPRSDFPVLAAPAHIALRTHRSRSAKRSKAICL